MTFSFEPVAVTLSSCKTGTNTFWLYLVSVGFQGNFKFHLGEKKKSLLVHEFLHRLIQLTSLYYLLQDFAEKATTLVLNSSLLWI